MGSVDLQSLDIFYDQAVDLIKLHLGIEVNRDIPLTDLQILLQEVSRKIQESTTIQDTEQFKKYKQKFKRLI
jgi:hypothetical protein